MLFCTCKGQLRNNKKFFHAYFIQYKTYCVRVKILNFYEFLAENIEQIKRSSLYRKLRVFSSRSGPYVKYNGKKVIQVSSNNYLGLAGDVRLQRAVSEAVKKYGVGSTGSRLISGTHELHARLEEQIAELKGTERAIVFSSGYDANLGTLSALLGEDDAVYSDELNHASIIDGIRLSKAQKFIYKHCDVEHLRELLSENHYKYKLNLIVTDSIFSMDGNRAPLQEIVKLKECYGAVLFVDEAHSFGIYGPHGEGLVHELGIADKVDIQMGTLSKAAGSKGGYIAGSNDLIEYLANKSRAFIFSTAPAIPSIAASIEAVEIIKKAHNLRKKLHGNIKYLKKKLEEQKFNLIPSESAIFCIKFDDIEQTCQVSEQLLDKYNVMAFAIRPPTVEIPRIRLCTMALHEKSDLDYLVRSLSELLNLNRKV